jgi:RNA polymerase sigma factor (sigma-70 family)
VVLIDATPTAEAVVLARERVARLSVCLGRLSEKTRDIFLAQRIDGMSYQQIAQRHRLSISTVEKHVAKATMQVTGWMEGWLRCSSPRRLPGGASLGMRTAW